MLSLLKFVYEETYYLNSINGIKVLFLAFPEVIDARGNNTEWTVRSLDTTVHSCPFPRYFLFIDFRI